MPIVLYKPGNTHKENGVACAILRCPAETLKQRLAEGWKTNVEDISNEKEPTGDIAKVEFDGPSLSDLEAENKILLEKVTLLEEQNDLLKQEIETAKGETDKTVAEGDTPPETAATTSDAPKATPPETPVVTAQATTTPAPTLEELKDEAKAKGVTNWWSKNEATLRTELGYEQGS
jgi:hypothetical protein